jgi:chromosome segregation ATPase
MKMYTPEQVSTTLNSHTKEIASLKSSVDALQHRTDSNERLISGLHELAVTVAGNSTEIKHLAEIVRRQSNRIEEGQKSQGERIGNIEKITQHVKQHDKDITEHDKRLSEIEKEPGSKWKAFKVHFISCIITAVVVYFFAKFT